jgi:hypothetical protein
MSDDVDAIALELLTLIETPMGIDLRPDTVIILVGLLQLALRHPAVAPDAPTATAGRRFIAGARAYFANCPTVLRVIAQGDDPAFDR